MNADAEAYNAFVETLSDEKKYSARDVERAIDRAIESTGEGFNAEWGYSFARQLRVLKESL